VALMGVRMSMNARNARISKGQRPAALVITIAMITSLVGLIAPTANAAAPATSASVDANNKYPLWYQDANGLRLAPCLEGSDPQCVLPPAGAEPQFNPANPTVFPTNFPSEFFYDLADSDHLATPGCRSSKAGTAFIRMAVEGAFASADGLPAPNQQVVFGRVRVRVTSGLCPNAPYTFTYPFGQFTITTNSAGAIPSTLGTTDIGCLAAPCDFSAALVSPIFHGFLRWDPAVGPAAPAGYIGDPAVLHSVTGATFEPGGAGTGFANYFGIVGERVAGLQTNQWNVSGRIAGPLMSSPTALDLGGQLVGTTGAARTVTLTNVGADPLTISGFALAGANPASFAVDSQTCTGAALAQDASCTVGITFSPTAAGVQTAVLQVPHDGLGSPFTVNLAGTGTSVGTVAVASPAPAALTFGPQRIGVASPSKRVTVTNTGTAPLEVSGVNLTGLEAADFIVFNDACTSAVIPAGSNCVIDVAFLPHGPVGLSSSSLDIASNVAPVSVGLTGTAIGGVAAVSAGTQATSGYPDWYQDENGVRVSPCTDGTDPNCVLPPAEPLWSPLVPPDMTTDPINFPSEFFYQLSDSDQLTTPGCGAIAPGRAFIRMGVEGAFLGLGGPVQGEQIVFGRIRVFASGLCPNTEYQFINPYGVERFTTNAAGTITRVAGTEDIGCLGVVPPATCNFADALQSRVLAGFLRWDPSVSPAAPAGYLGDAVSLHRVIGGSYIPPGEATPVDYLRIVRSDAPLTTIAETNMWTISGKLAGPLLSNPGDVTFPSTVVGETSAPTTVTITNAGTSPVTVGTATASGDFAIAAGTDLCSGQSLLSAGTCTIDVTFTPTATGNRNGQLSVPHSGLNTPVVVGLHGLGQAAAAPAISLTPAQLTFGSQHTGTASVPQTVTIANSGGAAPLDITSVTSDSANFTITGNTCDLTTLQPDLGNCTVDVSLTPTAAGALTGNLVIVDNDTDGPDSVPLSGTGFDGVPAVSAAVNANHGFPLWYQDVNGTRVEPCIEGSDPRCVLPGAPFNPGQPTAFPSNFPDEFFYWIADSNPVPVDGGTISIRMALEGTTAGVAGDQIAFGRIRIKALGAAANTTYTVVHPFGTATLTTDVGGGGVLTSDVGCAAPCNFADALASPVLGGFLRWDPRFGAAPAGYLGDALTPHRVVGAPFIFGGAPANLFRVIQGATTAGTVLGETNLFTVAGRLAAPLTAAPASLSFGDQVVTTPSAAQDVVVTNQGITPVTISVSVGGVDAADYAIGAGNTCTGSLASDTTCTVPVTFTPTADGPRTGLLTITPASGAPITVGLTGNGTGPMAASPTSLDFGAVERGTDSGLQTVTFTNLGAAPVNVTAPSVTGDFLLGPSDTCTGAALAQNVTCAVDVVFHPTVDGARTGTLRLGHDGANSPLPVGLTGSGTPPQVALANVTPATLDFGDQAVQVASTAKSVTVTNTGGVNLIVGSVSVTGTNASDFLATNGCNAAVTPGSQCTIDVEFTPAATLARSATLTITSNASPAQNTVALSGTGTQPASTISPASLTFASQRVLTTSTSQAVTVKNTGTGLMHVTAVDFGGQNPASFVAANHCNVALGAGATCTVDVSFRPQASGALSASLRIYSDGTQTPPQTVSLTGTGIASDVTLKNTTLSFGNIRVGSSTTKSLTIQNNGTATLNFTSFTFSGAAPGDYSITQNTCAGGPIAVRGKCSITIRFAPTVTGLRTANLVLVDDAPNSPQSVPLTGNGR